MNPALSAANLVVDTGRPHVPCYRSLTLILESESGAGRYQSRFPDQPEKVSGLPGLLSHYTGSAGRYKLRRRQRMILCPTADCSSQRSISALLKRQRLPI